MLLLLSLAVGARAAPSRGDDGPLQETRGGVTIDWQAGTLAATGGAAADLRMPSVDLARPGAERRAHDAALGKLRTALATLPLGGGRNLGAAVIDRALGRARVVDTQYQSNGGAVVRLEIRFVDWLEEKEPPTLILSVPAMRLGAAPPATIDGREIAIGAAIFHLGAPPPGSNPLAAHVDRAGRLIIERGAVPAAKLAAGLAVIYVQKVQK